jgi:hypothetical protein
MVRSVLLVAAAWVVLSAFGLLLLTAVSPQLRSKLVPASPLVGAAFLVAGLHLTGLVLPIGPGVIIVAVVGLVIAAVGIRRGAARPFIDRSGILWTLVSVAVGIPFALVAMAPNLILHDSRIVSATSNHDAIWYVSVSTWFQHHTLLEVPQIATAPGVPSDALGNVPGVIADGPAVSALTIPMRVGHDLVQAALNFVTGTSPEVTFSPWLAAWVLLVPGGCVAAAAVLRMNRGVGVAAGVLIASSHVLVVQVYNQNAASALGIAMAPLALACCVAALDRRVPLLLAGVLLSGVIGIYTEYTPFVGPALVGAALLRRHHFRATLVRAVALFGCAVLVAPYVWVRAADSLLGSSKVIEAPSGSPFRNAPVLVVLNRLVGVGPVDAGLQPSNVAWALAAVLVVGGLLALALSPHRGLWIGMLAVGVPFIAWLSWRQLGYTQRRSIDILFPVLLFMAASGYAELLRRIAARRAQRRNEDAAPDAPGTEGGARDAEPLGGVPHGSGTGGAWAAEPSGSTLLASRVSAPVREASAEEHPRRRHRQLMPVALVAVLAIGFLAVWAGLNTRTNLAAFYEPSLAPRHIDNDFSDAAQWVRDVGGPEGEDVSVLVPSFFEQQWIAYSLADEQDVEYPGVRPSYFRTESYWAGGTDRYLLIGQGVQWDGDPDVEVFGNARFKLLDLSRGDAVIVAPHVLTGWNTQVRADGGFTTLGNAKALVLRSPSADRDISFTLRSEFAAPFDATVTATGEPPVVVDDMTQEAVDVPIELPAGHEPVVVDLATEVPTDPTVAYWIELAGVSRD